MTENNHWGSKTCFVKEGGFFYLIFSTQEGTESTFFSDLTLWILLIGKSEIVFPSSISELYTGLVNTFAWDKSMTSWKFLKCGLAQDLIKSNNTEIAGQFQPVNTYCRKYQLMIMSLCIRVLRHANFGILSEISTWLKVPKAVFLSILTRKN